MILAMKTSDQIREMGHSVFAFVMAVSGLPFPLFPDVAYMCV